MQSSNGEMEDGYEHKVRSSGETMASLLGGKVAELQKLREKLMKAKDVVGQSWLDSRPLIDELQKLQLELESAKCRVTISTTVLSDLESQLESVNMLIRSTKEEETKMQTMVKAINQDIQEIQEEMEQLKGERDENRQARGLLKEELRLKKQTLRALQLALRAIRLESEAYAASAAEAHRLLNLSLMDDATVSLTREEYSALTKKAKEETSLAEWRILVSIEQKNAAEKSQDSIARRLQRLKSNNGSKKTEAFDLGNEQTAAAVGELILDVVPVGHTINEQNGIRKTRSQLLAKSSLKKHKQQIKRLKSTTYSSSQKREGSTLSWLRLCLVKCKCFSG